MKKSIVRLIIAVMLVGCIVNEVKPMSGAQKVVASVTAGVAALTAGYGLYQYYADYLENMIVDDICVALKPWKDCSDNDKRGQAKLLCRARRIAALLKKKGHGFKGIGIEGFLKILDLARGKETISWDKPMIAMVKLATGKKTPNPFEKEECEKAEGFGYAQWNSFIDNRIVDAIVLEQKISPEQQKKNTERKKRILNTVVQRGCVSADKTRYLENATYLIDLFG